MKIKSPYNTEEIIKTKEAIKAFITDLKTQYPEKLITMSVTIADGEYIKLDRITYNFYGKEKIEVID